jgi:hypothetical protein
MPTTWINPRLQQPAFSVRSSRLLHQHDRHTVRLSNASISVGIPRLTGQLITRDAPDLKITGWLCEQQMYMVMLCTSMQLDFAGDNLAACSNSTSHVRNPSFEAQIIIRTIDLLTASDIPCRTTTVTGCITRYFFLLWNPGVGKRGINSPYRESPLETRLPFVEYELHCTCRFDGWGHVGSPASIEQEQFSPT